MERSRAQAAPHRLDDTGAGLLPYGRNFAPRASDNTTMKYRAAMCLLAMWGCAAQGKEPPRLSYTCCDVEYGWAEAKGGVRVRTITTKPKNAHGRLPAILFTAWLSCDSVVHSGKSDEARDGWPALLE